MLTRKAVFEGTKYEEVYKKNKEMNIKLEGERYSNVDPQAMNLLRKMLLSNPKERVSAEEALNHEYFQSIQPESENKLYSPCLTKASEKKGNRVLVK